jgi:putative heme transporter
MTSASDPSAADLEALGRVFAAPRWLKDFGITAWLGVGVAALLAVIFWVLAQASTIVVPVIVGGVIAAIAAPAVTWLTRHRLPRLAAAFLLLLALVALGVVMLLLVLGGLTSQSGAIGTYLQDAADKATTWLNDVGVDQSGAASAESTVTSTVPDMIRTFVHGTIATIGGISALIFGLVFATFTLLFLLKDGPMMRRWVEGHMAVPRSVAHVITGGTLSSLRRYFIGVTIVAAFNAVVVGAGALILGVPLAGTIAVVTFVTAYVPFVGAFVSGAFVVLIALGAEGTSTALVMLVIVLLANGLLQNIVQPIAFGATLGIHPLITLIATIGFGALFGMTGLILGAPLTAAAVHVSRDLARARAGPEAEPVPEPKAPPERAAPSPA